MLSACNWMYFHDDEFEKQAKLTADTVKELDASKDIGAWDKRLDGLQAQYETKRTEQMLITRNLEIARVMTGDSLVFGDSRPIGVGFLRQRVWARLTDITSLTEDTATPAELSKWSNLIAKIDSVQRAIADGSSELQRARANYVERAKKEDKKRDLSCSAILAQFPAAPVQDTSDPVNADLIVIWESCSNLFGNYDQLPTLLAKYLQMGEPSWQGEATKLSRDSAELCKSEDIVGGQLEAELAEALDADRPATLARLAEQYGKITAREQRYQACQKLISGKLEKLNKELSGDDASDDSDKEKSSSDLASKLDDIKGLLDKAPPLVKIDGLETMISTLEAVAKLDLGTLAKGDASVTTELPSECTSGATASAKTCLAPAVLSVLQEGVVTAAALKKLVPEERLAVILKELSSLKLQLDLAQADRQAEISRKAIVEAMIEAVSAEASILVVSANALGDVPGVGDTTKLSDISSKSTRQRLGLALASYSSSWESGRIPLRLLEIRDIRIEHYHQLARDVAVAKWSKQTIDQAVAAVHAYAQGGINIDDLMSFLAHLGIIAAIAA